MLARNVSQPPGFGDHFRCSIIEFPELFECAAIIEIVLQHLTHVSFRTIKLSLCCQNRGVSREVRS